eukprot:TRINITY_DN37514_c0_g1_i1.p1 TRINITY_DN37514_c0_g1~~TRINITY_DN37514_c0_g1_i1.p1  ORF type:complete len:550 (-),score=140.30 TRINITY_DN37514_c0_g1_i1:102-1751(-)
MLENGAGAGAGDESPPESPTSPDSPTSPSTWAVEDASPEPQEIVPVVSGRPSMERRNSLRSDFTFADFDDSPPPPPQEPKDPGRDEVYIFSRFDVAAAYFGVTATIMWVISVVVMLFCFTLYYSGMGVDIARQRYTGIAAQRVGVEAAGVLSGALATVSAVAYSIERKRYFEPMDFVGARKMLEPTFSANPALRSVDLAFTNRSTSMRLSRVLNGYELDPSLRQGQKPVTLLIQSDIEECLAQLGPMGCLRSKPAANETAWYREGLTLHAGLENTPSEGPNEDISTWLKAPVFVDAPPMEIEDIGPTTTTTRKPREWWDTSDGLEDSYRADCSSVRFESAVQLVFRVPLPGTRGYVSCIGRATVTIGAIREAGALVDREALGDSGIILLCDRSGHVLAHIRPGHQAFIEGGSGFTRPRFAWELGDYEWAGHLKSEHFLDAATFEGMAAAGYQLTLQLVPGKGMDRFVVVVASERGAFVDMVLEGLGWSALSFVWLPVPAFFGVFGIMHLYEMYRKHRKRKRVHPMPATKVAQQPSLPPVSSSALALASG